MLKCPCCGERDGVRPMNFTEFELGQVLLCDWCEEGLIEGDTRKGLADKIKARLRTRYDDFKEG